MRLIILYQICDPCDDVIPSQDQAQGEVFCRDLSGQRSGDTRTKGVAPEEDRGSRLNDPPSCILKDGPAGINATVNRWEAGSFSQAFRSVEELEKPILEVKNLQRAWRP